MTSSNETKRVIERKEKKRAPRKDEKFWRGLFLLSPSKNENKGEGRPRWQEKVRKVVEMGIGIESM